MLTLHSAIERNIILRGLDGTEAAPISSVTTLLPTANDQVQVNGDACVVVETVLVPAGVEGVGSLDVVNVYVENIEERDAAYRAQFAAYLEREAIRVAQELTEPVAEPVAAEFNGKTYEDAITPQEGDLCPTPSSPGQWGEPLQGVPADTDPSEPALVTDAGEVPVPKKAKKTGKKKARPAPAATPQGSADEAIG